MESAERAKPPRRIAHATACFFSFGLFAALSGGCVTSGNLRQNASSSDEALPAEACNETSTGSDGDELVCQRWACSHQGLSVAAWDGDAKTCAPGRIDEQAQESALRLVNAYRFLAGVPEIEAESKWADPAQDCALLAHANHQLSHTPPHDWSCWSDRGARASAVSLIANRSAPLSVDPFIEDPGNESTMVHRRWLLSEKIHRVSFGSTNAFACAVVDGREFEAPSGDGQVPGKDGTTGSASQALSSAAVKEWVAWPSGRVPIDAVRRTKVDTTGWTIQSSTLDLDGAGVEVRVAGEPRRVKTFALERTLGSLTAIRFVPDGWSTDAGTRYDVRVAKGDIAIDFSVEPIDCR